MKKQIIDIDAEFDGFELDEKSIQKYTAGQKASDTMKGKTLEQILGSKERAEAGKEARRQANSKIDYTERRAKGAKTRRDSGGYDVGTMTGKQHNESTKSIMSLKAEIRQELKRKHALGKNDSVPQEFLDKAYKKAGLI
jgi:transcription initiation factor TFIIIB Brf1 subunit/transcription initiation factor TFIIB